MEDSRETPLFVDLDGTYTKTDLLAESFIFAVRKNPLIILYCMYWLIGGIANLKYKLSLLADIDTSLLPLNQEFHKYLKQQKLKGRTLYLATASNEKYAKEIAYKYNLFDGYISSCKSTNLKGKEKLRRIKEISENFSYAGNDSVDFEIFKEADEKLLVNPSYKAKRKAKHYDNIRLLDKHRPSLSIWLSQLRVHQWLKNLLLFVPIVVSGNFFHIESIFSVALAFLSFSFLASSTYIINDLVDLESDRSHPRKKNRPLANGSISIKDGIIVSLILFSLSSFISISISYDFSFIIFSYLFLTLSYSFKFKQYIGMDVISLSLLYTLRILAGSSAIQVETSFWLLSFSLFIFLSLALVKRCSELQSMRQEGKNRARGRDYTIEDYSILISFGASNAMLSILMFCFYTNNNVLTKEYQQPNILWLIVPALCYWIMRMWIKTHRGEMHDDPIVFSLTDKGSLFTISFCGFIAILAQLI